MNYELTERVRAILESVAEAYNGSGRMRSEAPTAAGGAVWRMRLDLASAGVPRLWGEIGIKYTVLPARDDEDDERFAERFRNTKERDACFGRSFRYGDYWTDDDIRREFQALLELAHARVRREAAT